MLFRSDIDEYGERTARVAASKTRGDLLVLFKDLPEPRPTFTPPAQAAAPPPQPQQPPGPPPVERPVSVRVYAALVPVAWVLTAVLFFTVFRSPFVFLLPVLVMLLGASIWGDEFTHERRAQRDRGRQHRHNARYWRDDPRGHWHNRDDRY